MKPSSVIMARTQGSQHVVPFRFQCRLAEAELILNEANARIADDLHFLPVFTAASDVVIHSSAIAGAMLWPTLDDYLMDTSNPFNSGLVDTACHNYSRACGMLKSLDEGKKPVLAVSSFRAAIGVEDYRMENWDGVNTSALVAVTKFEAELYRQRMHAVFLRHQQPMRMFFNVPGMPHVDFAEFYRTMERRASGELKRVTVLRHDLRPGEVP